jgi:Phage protein Gp138 N-terminal domain
MSGIKQTPNLMDLLNLFKKTTIDSINAVNIGVVQSFDTAKQTASIQLSIKRVLEVKEDGTKVMQDRPLLAQVPCVILGGSHNVRVPILAGDIALVFFNDKDIDNWFTANNGTPNTSRMHDISDGIAITGLHNVANLITDFLNDRISVYWDASNKLEVLSGAINALTTLMTITGALNVTGAVSAGNGATGSILATNAPGHSITVVNGIVTAIS